MSPLRDVSRETASMRRAKRWLAEMREDAAKHGGALSAETEALFGHMSSCPDCELRENNDPTFCEVADEIMGGLADAEDRAFAAAESEEE